MSDSEARHCSTEAGGDESREAQYCEGGSGAEYSDGSAASHKFAIMPQRQEETNNHQSDLLPPFPSFACLLVSRQPWDGREAREAGRGRGKAFTITTRSLSTNIMG
ncbi:hypothetical protein E2C01_095540 [Portunus trituberculatus]|uniref:Uncharacterized protein n=1 Tax=Portunus trituberculatus TaxID=210409 RepID=A0A5B7JZ46_PORTR|nr:hypothetical protein [Portunus trituberculatus]